MEDDDERFIYDIPRVPEMAPGSCWFNLEAMDGASCHRLGRQKRSFAG